MKLQAFDSGAARAARRVLEYNPYHGKDGRFTGKSGAASTVAYAGKRPDSIGKGKAAIRREMAADAEMKRKFPNGPTMYGWKQRTTAAGEWHATAAGLAKSARTALGRGDRKAVDRAVELAHRASGNARRLGGRPAAPEHREHVPQDPKRYTQGKRVYPGKPIPERAQAFERSRRSEYERTQSLAPYAKSIRQTQHDSSAPRVNYHASAERNFGKARRLSASANTDLRLGYGYESARARRDARTYVAVGKQDRRYARVHDLARAIGTGKSRRQERAELASKKKGG